MTDWTPQLIDALTTLERYKAICYTDDFCPRPGDSFRGFGAGWVYEIESWSGRKGIVRQYRELYEPKDLDCICCHFPASLVDVI